MLNPSEKGMRDKLLLEMGECIDKLIEDPYDDEYESELLSIRDVYNHMTLLGFKKASNTIEHNALWVGLIDRDGNNWTIYGNGIRGGVSLSKNEEDEYEESEDYYEDEESKDEDEEEVELTKEELGNLPD